MFIRVGSRILSVSIIEEIYLDEKGIILKRVGKEPEIILEAKTEESCPCDLDHVQAFMKICDDLMPKNPLDFMGGMLEKICNETKKTLEEKEKEEIE